MIPEKLKNLWPLIYTWLNGGRVQIKIISNWRDVQSISDFKNFNNEFRVYSEPKLVPFTFKDNLLGKIVVYSDESKAMITAQKKDGVYIGGSLNLTSYSNLMTFVKFEDGSPCGKYVE